MSSTATHAIGDTTTMVRRKLRHVARYPSMTVMLVAVPVVFLLLFVYVFGGTLGAGIGGAGGGRSDYVDYVAPGIILLTVVSAATSTAVSVAMDMTEGIVARFRTMAIFRPSMLTGHVVGAMIQTLLSLLAVLAVALVVGFRPTAGVAGWLAAIGLLVLVSLAITWFAVALGLVTDSVETASNLPMPLMLLPFLGSGFVPTESMPTAIRWFADYQPFTPIIESLRGLLMGTPITGDLPVAVGWCVAITVGCFFWARHLFERAASR